MPRRRPHVRLQIGSDAPLSEIDSPDVRDVDDSYVGFVIAHQRDIDRKFAVSLEKLLGSVQRIDHPEQIPVTAFLVQQVAPLLAQQRNARLTQIVLDQLVRLAVGYGDRRMIAFQVDAVIRVAV